MRTCNICGIEKPLTVDYYHFRNDTGKFRNVCNECFAEQCKARYYNRPKKVKDEEQRFVLNRDGLKLCRTCDRILPHYEFIKSKRSWDGFAPSCKGCRNEYLKSWSSRNKEKVKEYQKEYAKNHRETIREKKRIYEQNNREKLQTFRNDSYRRSARKLRLEVLQRYSGELPECACCHEQRIEFLVIDHVEGGGSEHRNKLKLKGSSFYRWLKKNNYPPEFRVLCHNCNSSFGLYGYCPHDSELERKPQR